MIFLFNDMFGNYLYDSVVNDTIEVSDTFYHSAKNGSLDLSDPNIRKEYQKLESLGYYPEQRNTLTFTEFKFLEPLLNRLLSKMTLQVTQACNFRCKYCAYSENDGLERTHSSKFMNWSTAKKAIDLFHDHSIDSPIVTIGFYGGEPLLNYPLVKQCILYAEEIFSGKQLLFVMTTNATLLTDEMLAFFDGREVALTISLDGPQQLNDRNRVFDNGSGSTFDAVKAVIQKIATSYKHVFQSLSINMVLDPSVPYDQYQKIYSDIPELYDISVRASTVNDDNLVHKHTFCQDYVCEVEYAKFMYRLIDRTSDEHLRSINKENIMFGGFEQRKSQISQTLGPHNHAMSPSGPCVPAYDKLFVDVAGHFLPCEKVSEIVSDLQIGDVDSGIDKRAVERLANVASITREECAKCWCFNMCSSCVRYCVDSNGLSKKARLASCKASRNNAMEMLYQYVSMKRNGEIGE